MFSVSSTGHLLVLFGGLSLSPRRWPEPVCPADALAALTAAGIDAKGIAPMALALLIGGNVPTVVLLLAVLKDLPAETLYIMAALSTLAGNLLIVGSLANVIVVERTKDAGVTLGFVEHARCGVPIALISLAAAIAWFAGRAIVGL